MSETTPKAMTFVSFDLTLRYYESGELTKTRPRPAFRMGVSSGKNRVHAPEQIAKQLRTLADEVLEEAARRDARQRVALDQLAKARGGS